MKKKYFNIIFQFLLLATFVTSCMDSDETLQEILQPQTKYAKVAFNVTVPLNSLPSSRAISDDTGIDSYVIWVFDNGKFVEAVKEGDTYMDSEENTHPRINFHPNTGEMYLMLREDLMNVQLAMIANVANLPTPTSTNTMEAARNLLSTFTYTHDPSKQEFMPMYGENSTTFAVTHGADGGTITLLRALAKVEVDTSDARDHFTLQEMYVYRVNSTGTIVAKNTIANNNPTSTRIKGTVEGTLGYVYLPEIADVKPDANADIKKGKSFVIIKGQYRKTLNDEPVVKYYRLDFIKRIKEVGEAVTYEYVDDIKRNHCYIFEIDFLTEGAGHGSLDEAIAAEADNRIIENTQLMVIDDVDVMDITTDNFIYLGVTAGNLTAKKIAGNYYAVRIRVVTNNSNGWKIEQLPANVSVTMNSWKPGQNEDVETAQSVWVYIDSSVGSGKTKTIYIYSGNIRKTITITTE